MEPIAVINQRLLDYYGRSSENQAIWRVVWSDDQYEKKYSNVTKGGIELLGKTLQTMPKYSYIHARYVLEKLVPVPEGAVVEFDEKTSYEPIWTFEDKNGNPLPPKWEAIELLIKTIMDNMNRATSPYARYMAELKDTNTKEGIEERVRILEEELFGNETRIGDSLAVDNGVGYGVRQRHDN